MKSFYYSVKKAVTSTEQSVALPILRNIEVFNQGTKDVFVDFDTAISDDSVLLPAGSKINVTVQINSVSLKCATGESTTVYLLGLRQDKE